MTTPFEQDRYIHDVKQRAETLSKYFSLRCTRQTVANFNIKKRLPPRFIEFALNLYDVLEQIYPGNGDVQFELEPRFKTFRNSYGLNQAGMNEFQLFDKFMITYINIIIRFPEVRITNSSGNSLLLKDLFVKIKVQVSDHSTRGKLFFNTPIQGLRATVTPLEVQNNYSHSHLGRLSHLSQSSLKFHNFCMGDSDVISAAMLLNDKLDPDMLNLMLSQVRNYVEWESLEGGPYIKMATLTNKGQDYTSLDISQAKTAYYELVNEIGTGRSKIDCDWNYYNGKYVIIDNEKFERNLFNIYTSYFTRKISRVPKLYVVHKDERGEYYSPANETVSDYQRERPYLWIPFRNEKVYFRVEVQPTQISVTNQKYLNPKIKNYVKHRLEHQANYSTIREAGIKELNQGTNT